MVLAAKLRTLTKVNTLFRWLEPKLGNPARYAVLFHSESRYRPAVDHVRASDCHHNDFVYRNNHGCICCQQKFVFAVPRIRQFRFHRRIQHVRTNIRIRRPRICVYCRWSTKQVAVKTKAVVCVLIPPIPLISGHFDIHVTFGDLLLTKQFRKREHGNPKKDEYRNDRPSYFKLCIMSEIRRCRVCFAVKADYRVEQKSHNKQHDQRNHDQKPKI